MRKLLPICFTVLLMCGGISCVRDEVPAGDRGGGSLSVGEARKIFERSLAAAATRGADLDAAPGLTPGHFTPEWDDAVQTGNDLISGVDVPFNSSYAYVGLFKVRHDDFSKFLMRYSTRIYQKITVVKDKAGNNACYVMSIIPSYEYAYKHKDIKERFRRFRGSDFSGIVLYSMLEGNITVQVDVFENGSRIDGASVWDRTRTNEESFARMRSFFDGATIVKHRVSAATRSGESGTGFPDGTGSDNNPVVIDPVIVPPGGGSNPPPPYYPNVPPGGDGTTPPPPEPEEDVIVCISTDESTYTIGAVYSLNVVHNVKASDLTSISWAYSSPSSSEEFGPIPGTYGNSSIAVQAKLPGHWTYKVKITKGYQTYESEPLTVVHDYPTIGWIMTSTSLVNAMKAAFVEGTCNFCTAQYAVEIGYQVNMNTTVWPPVYELGSTRDTSNPPHDFVASGGGGGASVLISVRENYSEEFNKGGVFYVATFHTHPTYSHYKGSPALRRKIGVSDNVDANGNHSGDIPEANRIEAPGVIWDYKGDRAGWHYSSDPIDSESKYTVYGPSKRTLKK